MLNRDKVDIGQNYLAGVRPEPSLVLRVRMVAALSLTSSCNNTRSENKAVVGLPNVCYKYSRVTLCRL